jgi:hypothetical protein
MRRIDLLRGKLFPSSMDDGPIPRSRCQGVEGNYHGEADLSAARPELENVFFCVTRSAACRSRGDEARGTWQIRASQLGVSIAVVAIVG